MFFFFVVLMAINSTMNSDLLFKLRVDIAGLPINLVDFALVVLLILGVISPGRERTLVERVHPLLMWSVGLFFMTLVVGIMGAMSSGVDVRAFVTVVRNVVCLPLAIIAGYLLIQNPRSARLVCGAWILASIASAIAVLFVAGGTVEKLSEGSGSFDKLREIRYGGDIGLWAFTFIAFTVISRVRYYPMVVALGVIVICAGGFFSMPHRGGYLIGVLTFLFASMVLPRVTFWRRAHMVLVGGLLLGIVLLSGAALYSWASGKDFTDYVINKRLKQMVPGFEDETHTTITATRMPGIQRELEIWAKSPLFGAGFAISKKAEADGAVGMNHNVWTATMAETGLFGLAAYSISIIGSLVVGFRLWRAQTERFTSTIGALGAIVALSAFFNATLSLSINTQRSAVPLGLMAGIIFRCRVIQLTFLRARADRLKVDPALTEGEFRVSDWEPGHAPNRDANTSPWDHREMIPPAY